MWTCCGAINQKRKLQRALSTNPELQRALSTNENERRAQTRTNQKLNKYLAVTDLNTKKGYILRVLVAFLYFGWAVGSFFLCRMLGQHPPAVFWLGRWPHATLAVTMFAVATSFFLLVRVRIIRYYRVQEMRGSHNEKGGLTALGRLRPMVVFSAVLGLAAGVVGAVTEYKAEDARSNLAAACHYPKENSAETQELAMQNVSDSLVRFQRRCQILQTDDIKSINECQGFDQEFPESSSLALYVRYLMNLERLEPCVGWCYMNDALILKGRKRLPNPKDDIT